MGAQKSNLNSNDLFRSICKALPSSPNFINESFWSDGENILCPTEADCSLLAKFIEEICYDKNQSIITGYFDPDEDVRNNEQDDYTGFWYITIE